MGRYRRQHSRSWKPAYLNRYIFQPPSSAARQNPRPSDANVLSEATKPSPDPRVLEWLRRNERSLVVDPIVLGEVRFGILLLARGARRTELENWFEQGIGRIQCVSWDSAVGMRWAQLLADLRRHGKPMSIKDSLIAATALAHDLQLVTLNQRDFKPAKVQFVDPSS